MALLYETVAMPKKLRGQRLQEITTKTYRILFSPSLFTGWNPWETYTSEEKSIDIKWDEKATTLNQISLKGNLHAIQPFAAPSVGFRISVNGLATVSRDWLGDCTTATFDTNIYGKIRNGTNTLKLEVHKNTPGFGTCGFDNILIEIEAQFVGKPPDIKPTPETWLEKLIAFIQENALWIGLGTVTIVGVVTIPKIIEARRKKVAPAI